MTHHLLARLQILRASGNRERSPLPPSSPCNANVPVVVGLEVVDTRGPRSVRRPYNSPRQEDSDNTVLLDGGPDLGKRLVEIGSGRRRHPRRLGLGGGDVEEYLRGQAVELSVSQ